MNEMRILYISRKYPPSVGGMQRMNYCLARELSKKAKVEKNVWGHSQLFLPVFILKVLTSVFLRSVILRREYDVICIGDALLSPLAAALKNILRSPVVCIAHGLDVTFNNRLYQNIVIPSLKKLDLVVCVSENTKRECACRGIDEHKIICIPNGVEAKIEEEAGKDRFQCELKKRGLTLSGDAKVLLTVGRLVRRKGVAEFINDIFSDLIKDEPNTVYLIAGEGNERHRIERIIDKHSLNNSVYMLGYVGEDVMRSLYGCSDIFVMPNIRIDGDIEGFGIVALEAAAHEIPIVAFDVDGIRNAIKDNENGFLIPPDKPDMFLKKLLYLYHDEDARVKMGDNGRRFAKELSWDKIADRYVNAMKDLIEKKK